MKNAKAFFVVICFILTLIPFVAYGLTFTLSDDAIMALDYNYNFNGHVAAITSITDVEGPGVRFDIVIPNTRTDSLAWMSTIYGGAGKLTGRDISMFDSFALKFTLLSASGVSSPDAVGPVIVGSMITQSHYLWGFRPEVVEINDPHNPASATSVVKTDNAGKINLIGYTCYLPYWYDDGSSPEGAMISILVEPAPGAVVMTSDPCQVLQLLSVNKCTVAAGRKDNHDGISFSGKINPVYDDLSLSNVIRITIDSNNMPDPCVIMIPIKNDKYKKTGRFSYLGTDENGVRKSFKLNFKTNKFSFAARRLDLSGLSCPLNIKIDINDYSTEVNLGETIVNGPKKPIPINLLMGLKNSIRADKLKVRYSSKKDRSSFTVTGGFSVQDVNVDMAASPFSVTLDKQVFTIPANNFKFARGKYYCSNVKLQGSSAVAAAVFDFNRCTFALKVKNTNIDAQSGNTVNFAIDFTGFAEDTEAYIPYP